jgi:hypothetical protein
MSQLRRSSDGSTLVDVDCHWRDIAVEPPPLGVKLLFINRKLGTATIGFYEKESSQFSHYAGLPIFQD